MAEEKHNIYTAIRDMDMSEKQDPNKRFNIYTALGFRSENDEPNFSGHYTNRYKKMSESVEAYDVDVQDAFNKGEILPSAVPRETLGMPEEQHNLIASQRADANQMRIDNPVIRINDDGTQEVLLEAKHVDTEGKEVQKNYNDLNPEEQTNFWKMKMLDGMREKRVSRTIIDPDQIYDPDTGMNMALKVATEIGEGLAEGFENTARSASILAYDIFPPTEPIGQAYADILNSNAISTTDLRAGFLPDVKDAEGIGYGFLRGIAQFAPNFIGFNRALSGFSSLRSANMTRGFLAGMPTDALAFDSVDGNLHDLAISAGEVEIAGLGKVNLDNEYTQFMSASAQDTQAEGRFRNVVEGGIIGVAFDAAIRGVGRGYTKAQEAGLRKKFTELYVSTAKNLRDFRFDSANRLEKNAVNTISGLKTTDAFDKGAKVESVKPLSEIALSKLLKGEIKDFGEWEKELDKFLPESLKRQSGIDVDPDQVSDTAIKEVMDRNVGFGAADTGQADVQKIVTDTPEFKEWFGESSVIDESGEPMVVYHGTTHDIEAFTPDRGNPENDMGLGYYFTNSEVDVSENYAGKGPDLTQRIELRAEQLVNEIPDDSDELIKRVAKKMDQPVEDISDALDEYTDALDEERMVMARENAESELSGGQANVMPVYLSMKKPVIIGSADETRFEYEEIVDVDEMKPQARDEVISDNPDIEVDSDEFNELVLERADQLARENDYIDEGGSLLDFIEGLRSASYEFGGVDIQATIDDIMEQANYESISAKDLIDIIKKSEGSVYAEFGDMGEMANGELIRKAFELSDYDGIVDHTVADKWGSSSGRANIMEGVDYDTAHYIAFEPTQIKSSIGNIGTFDKSDPSVLRAFAPLLGLGVASQLAQESWNNAVEYQNSMSRENDNK